jgi:hypothetical protein
MPARRRTQTEQDHFIEVETFAEGLSKQYLLCRTYGHSWQPHSAGRVQDHEGHPTAVWEQVLRCKCRVKRVLLLSSEFDLVVSRHDYRDAPGYLTEGIGRITGHSKAALRKVSILRLIGQEEAA